MRIFIFYFIFSIYFSGLWKGWMQKGSETLFWCINTFWCGECSGHKSTGLCFMNLCKRIELVEQRKIPYGRLMIGIFVLFGACFRSSWDLVASLHGTIYPVICMSCWNISLLASRVSLSPRPRESFAAFPSLEADKAFLVLFLAVEREHSPSEICAAQHISQDCLLKTFVDLQHSVLLRPRVRFKSVSTLLKCRLIPSPAGRSCPPRLTKQTAKTSNPCSRSAAAR